jgi:late competence protein required for DNA uptake (superfamily II DNA/RNA helicase)
LLSWRFEFER